MEKGEEILSALTALGKKENIRLAQVQAIGAVKQAVVGLYQTEQQQYVTRTIKGDREILSLTGSVTEQGGEPYLHLHVALADEAGRVDGGHLNEAVVSATCEMFLTLFNGKIDRKRDPQVGLNLFHFL